MLTYLLDGNNIYHFIPNLRDDVNPRLALIKFIKQNRLTGSHVNKVIIVFDGHDGENVNDGSFKIIFSKDREADEIIKNKIGSFKNKKQLIVVTNDNSIKNYAKMEGACIKTVTEFVDNRSNKKNTFDNKDQLEERKLFPSLYDDITMEMEKIWIKKEGQDD